MRTRFPALCAAIALATGLGAPQIAHAAAEAVGQAAGELKLAVGKGQLIRLDRPARTVFIADPAVADVQVKSPSLVYVVAKAPGGTSLFAVDAKEQMIANLAINVGWDAERLAQVLKQHAPESDVQVASVNDSIVLSGKVASPAQGEEILRLAYRFLIREDDADKSDSGARLINRLTVEASNQVNLRVRVAEVSKQAREVLGVNWDSFAEVGGTVLGLATGRSIRELGAPKTFLRGSEVDSVIGSYQHGTADINVMVDALSKKGLVKVLAEPNLTAISGEPASFLAGGEYPIPVPQGDERITVDYKRYGVSLSFVATVLDGGRISLSVQPEVSQLSDAGAVTVNGLRVPALTTRRAQTTVELGSGQSFAIAGLLQRTTSEDLKKTPGLGDIPVLGQLFRSKEYQKSESELVIIVTPYLVKPVSQKLAMPADLRARPAAATPAVAEAAAETKSEKKG